VQPPEGKKPCGSRWATEAGQTITTNRGAMNTKNDLSARGKSVGTEQKPREKKGPGGKEARQGSIFFKNRKGRKTRAIFGKDPE